MPPGVDIVHVNPDLNDPDWLALVLRGLHELNEGDDHCLKASDAPESAAPSQTSSKLDEAILDSLACLLVHLPRDHVVAITILPPVHACIERSKFLIIQNAGVPSVVVRDQLKRIVDHIRSARHLYVDSLGADSSRKSSRLILPAVGRRRESLTPLEAELYDCEITIIWHCWEKIERRLLKDDRDTTFRELVGDVYGAPAADRQDLDDGERLVLGQLQSQGEAQRNTLTELATCVQMMDTLLVDKPGPPYDAGTSENDRKKLVVVRGFITHVYQILSDDEFKHMLQLCDKYLEAQRLRQAKISGTPQKSWTVTRWVTKFVSVRHDFAKILGFVRSRTMSSLLEKDPEILCVPARGQVERRVFEISDTDVRDVLRQAGWDDLKVEDYQDFLERLQSRLAFFQSNESPDEEPPTYHEKMAVHCECALLAHLHEEAKIRPPIPYVGLSKLSCQLCHLYFDCYSDITGTSVHTRGTHGQLVAWQTPSLLPASAAEDQQLRELLRGQLLRRLVTEVARSRTRQRLSTSSQSTVPSEGEEVINGPRMPGVVDNLTAMVDKMNKPPRERRTTTAA
ncbi:hypothetical protein OH76DRAFT_1474561 [Lentinus brumalis]|uniref:Uncharacterized protein n=1 Tax=Lentinus brumalis TaxID=2498619 RepID=A0A371CUV8_9APHY|nr:hypothetical protein OH76DRAFT_1474561 [Polyporus brumalis]